MVKGEMGKILEKMAEEARKKAMAEGLAKIEAMLAGRVAEREAVEAIHGGLAAKKAELAGVIEGMGAGALADMEAIKAAEDAANETNKKLNALQQKAAKEKADLKAALAKAKTEMTAERDAAAASLSEKKAAYEVAAAQYGEKKAGCIQAESANAAGKGDVLAIMGDIAKLDKTGTALLRDKKEALAAISNAEKMSWPSWVTLPSLTRPELPFSGIRRRRLLPLAMQRRCTGYTTGLSRSSPKPVSTSKC